MEAYSALVARGFVSDNHKCYEGGKLLLSLEQSYWSLNGSFEALYRISQAVKNGDIKDLEQLKSYIQSSMIEVNEGMNDYEGNKVQKT
jgi:hypothetical protein